MPVIRRQTQANNIQKYINTKITKTHNVWSSLSLSLSHLFTFLLLTNHFAQNDEILWFDSY